MQIKASRLRAARGMVWGRVLFFEEFEEFVGVAVEHTEDAHIVVVGGGVVGLEFVRCPNAFAVVGNGEFHHEFFGVEVVAGLEEFHAVDALGVANEYDLEEYAIIVAEADVVDAFDFKSDGSFAFFVAIAFVLEEFDEMGVA